ncbi:hypothetical protein RJ640_005831 [Escallonia rubra]|uniref:Fe2OG dioxygenase domain-containing protein n=1 Tax=Escallonia rubra TaxID=112253 RepID=A0AA88ULA5_9ASTE|nr:hypothetical protein RJ640_005831 [Escallonia rubra]
MTAAATQDYDRHKDIKQFDDRKIGVKGLVDSGITSIPRFFHHPPETRPAPTPTSRPDLAIPTIDLSAPRAAVIRQVHHASSTLGFFQIINHDIPQSLLHSLIVSIKSFNEQPAELKSPYYHRDPSRGGAAFSTNFDLYQSKAASWRDTLQMRLAPTPPNWDFVPDVCREAVAEWDTAVVRLGEELMGLLSEGLGLESAKLKDLTCLEGRVFVGHYYPYCPEPDLTVGTTSHTDPGVLTVLVQNEVGGLQVKCGEDWVDVDPVPGALVINIGDILQVRPFTAFAFLKKILYAEMYADFISDTASVAVERLQVKLVTDMLEEPRISAYCQGCSDRVKGVRLVDQIRLIEFLVMFCIRDIKALS